jgi:hypothetical protein
MWFLLLVQVGVTCDRAGRQAILPYLPYYRSALGGSKRTESSPSYLPRDGGLSGIRQQAYSSQFDVGPGWVDSSCECIRYLDITEAQEVLKGKGKGASQRVFTLPTRLQKK